MTPGECCTPLSYNVLLINPPSLHPSTLSIVIYSDYLAKSATAPLFAIMTFQLLVTRLKLRVRTFLSPSSSSSLAFTQRQPQPLFNKTVTVELFEKLPRLTNQNARNRDIYRFFDRLWPFCTANMFTSFFSMKSCELVSIAHRPVLITASRTYLSVL